MSDRITGLIVSVLALAFFASASQLETPFFADPLGPSAFPMLISAVAFVSGCVMVLRPDAGTKLACSFHICSLADRRFGACTLCLWIETSWLSFTNRTCCRGYFLSDQTGSACLVADWHLPVGLSFCHF